jgi:hypothetical protein
VRNPARERSRNLNREVWESPSVYGGEDVNVQEFHRTVLWRVRSSLVSTIIYPDLRPAVSMIVITPLAILIFITIFPDSQSELIGHFVTNTTENSSEIRNDYISLCWCWSVIIYIEVGSRLSVFSLVLLCSQSWGRKGRKSAGLLTTNRENNLFVL